MVKFLERGQSIAGDAANIGDCEVVGAAILEEISVIGGV